VQPERPLRVQGPDGAGRLVPIALLDRSLQGAELFCVHEFSSFVILFRAALIPPGPRNVKYRCGPPRRSGVFPMASLAGTLLVARSSLRDTFFGRSVILLLQHGAEGAFGLVLN